jgi:hypothetical protein
MRRIAAGALACLICAVLLLVLVDSPASAAVWYAGVGQHASDANPGTPTRPVATVAKAVSLAQPGDTVMFQAGSYRCEGVRIPDGLPDLPIMLSADGTARVVFTNDGRSDALYPGSHNTISSIEVEMRSDRPEGAGISFSQKEHVTVRNCRFYSCQYGVRADRSRCVTIENCEMAYSGAVGVQLTGSGDGPQGHWNPDDECRNIEVRNCYLHDAGWNVEGTEGYGINAYGAVDDLTIEHCQIDNNSGDGILYEDWSIHTTARHNVIRGTGIAAIWIDNATMSVFEGNYLEANNVAVWLSGEESSNRFLSDMVAIRNNIIVHNDWSAIDPSVYGKVIFLITSNTRDVYFDNNTVAFNNCERVVGVQARPPLTDFRDIWFRNNIFWQNTGAVGIDEGVDASQFRFLSNLWDKPYTGDAQAKSGEPLFVDARGHGPEAYRIQQGSAAKDQGLLLYENPLDFWNAPRPHLSRIEKYDLGAHELGVAGDAYAGLDRATFPFQVPPYELRFKAKPKWQETAASALGPG